MGIGGRVSAHEQTCINESSSKLMDIFPLESTCGLNSTSQMESISFRCYPALETLQVAKDG